MIINDKKMPKARRALIAFASSTLFVFVAGRIYTHFGHGVTSDSMTYAFIYLLIGLLVYCVLSFIKPIPYPITAAGCLFTFGLITLTVHSFMVGAFDIAGAVSKKAEILTVIGYILSAAGVFTYIVQLIYGAVKHKK